MIGRKQLFVIIILCVLESCREDIKNGSSGMMDSILSQYPMYVKISPNGETLLLKNRDVDFFEIICSNISKSRFEVIDRSKFTQLSLTWHPNNREIVFQEFSPKTRMYNLYKVRLDSKIRELIELPASNNAIPPLKWSKDGKYLAYLATNSSTKLFIYDYCNDKIVIELDGMNPYSSFEWSSDSTIIFNKNPLNTKLYEAGLDGDCRLIQNELIEDAELRNFSLKENGILITARKNDEEYFQCYEFSFKNSKIEQITFGNFNISNCYYSKFYDTIFYNCNENGVNKLYSNNPDINLLFDKSSKEGDSFEISRELKTKLYIKSHDYSSPPRLLCFDLARLDYAVLYEPPNSKDLKLKEPKFIYIKGSEEHEIPSYFWEADNEKDNRNTIIYVHGGPKLQSKPLWNMTAKIFTDNKINLLVINYQGSSGYSKKFSIFNDSEIQIQNVVSAAEWLELHCGIEQQDIVLVGSSYGGKIVIGAINQLSDLKGVALLSGVVNNKFELNDKLKNLCFLGFYGEFDPLSKEAYQFYMKNNLDINKKNSFKIFRGEGHNFHRTTSWSIVYRSIINIFS